MVFNFGLYAQLYEISFFNRSLYVNIFILTVQLWTSFFFWSLKQIGPQFIQSVYRFFVFKQQTSFKRQMKEKNLFIFFYLSVLINRCYRK